MSLAAPSTGSALPSVGSAASSSPAARSYAAGPTGGSARAIVDAEVRELLRRRAVDPVQDPDVAARVVDEVVSDYLDRAVTSRLPALGDVEQVSRSVLDAIAGFGPLQPLLDDPTIDEFRAAGG